MSVMIFLELQSNAENIEQLKSTLKELLPDTRNWEPLTAYRKNNYSELARRSISLQNSAHCSIQNPNHYFYHRYIYLRTVKKYQTGIVMPHVGLRISKDIKTRLFRSQQCNQSVIISSYPHHLRHTAILGPHPRQNPKYFSLMFNNALFINE